MCDLYENPSWCLLCYGLREAGRPGGRCAGLYSKSGWVCTRCMNVRPIAPANVPKPALSRVQSGFASLSLAPKVPPAPVPPGSVSPSYVVLNKEPEQQSVVYSGTQGGIKAVDPPVVSKLIGGASGCAPNERTTVTGGQSNCEPTCYCTECQCNDAAARATARSDGAPVVALSRYPRPRRGPNVYLKSYRFASENTNLGLTTNYVRNFAETTYHGMIPLGWGGSASLAPPVGYMTPSAGSIASFQSNDFSLMISAIPLWTADTDEFYTRLGSTIFIKRIRGRCKIHRYLSTRSTGTNKYVVPNRYPHVISYIQREPIGLLSITVPTDGGSNGCVGVFPYPAPGNGQANNTMNCDFVSYYGGTVNTGAVWPTLNQGVGWINNLNDPLMNISPLDRLHRSPDERTEVLALHREHLATKMTAAVVDSISGTANNGGVAPFAATVDPAQVPACTFDIPINHEFHGRGLQCDFDPQSTVTSHQTTNLLRWKIHFDTAGYLWDGTQTAPTNTWYAGYADFMEFEIWTEFYDSLADPLESG